MKEVQAIDPDHEWHELSLVYTNTHQLSKVHEDFLGHAKDTDVMSFVYPPQPPAQPGWHGEVLVNVERAVALGPRYEGAARELALYIAHGCQHLTGAEDHTPKLKQAMRRRERIWLARADKAGLLTPLTIQSKDS